MLHDTRETLNKQGCLIGMEIFIKWKIKVETVPRERIPIHIKTKKRSKCKK